MLSGDQFTLNDEYIAGYLSLWPGAHLTPYREIQSVAPAHFVRIRDTNIATHPYWTFNPRLKIRYQTDAEYEDHFRQLFRQAVRRRLRSDSTILAELSGGLDSSSIVCMAEDILAKEGAETPSIDTFSFCDREEPSEEDFLYFTKVEEKRGRIGHRAELKGLGDAFSFEYRQFVATPGFGVRQELKNAQLDVIRQNKYRVVLSGLGGDEFLGQALDPRVQMADSLVRLRVRELARQLLAWSLLMRRPLVQLFLETLALLFPISFRPRTRYVAKVESWINPKFASKHRFRCFLLPCASPKLRAHLK